MIFVDTGYLLAVLNPRDALFELAQVWASTVNDLLMTTDYVVWEMVNSFSDPVDRPKAHAAVAEIRSSAGWELVEASPQLSSEGLLLHERMTDKHWSLTDCVSFFIMQQRGITQALT